MLSVVTVFRKGEEAEWMGVTLSTDGRLEPFMFSQNIWINKVLAGK